MYGVERDDPPIKVKRDGGPGQYRDFATNCLLARRLVERGVRFVNIFHASWDHHEDVDGELPFYTGMADQPVAALIKDLKQRGLLDETLVVWGSEFGRTPLAQGVGGPRPSSLRLQHVPGRRRHPRRLRPRPDRRHRLGARRRSACTSTTCTPRCCTCSASTTAA